MAGGYLLMALQLGLPGGLWQGLVLTAAVLVPLESLLRRLLPLRWRSFILTGFLLATLCATVLGYINAQALPLVSPERVVLTEWTSQKPVKLIHVSDLHLGKGDLGRLSRIVDQINARRPDLIVLTGDILVGKGWPAAMADALAKLRAPLGLFAVRGNHEIRKGGEKAFREFCLKAGITPLVNQNLALDGLVLAGIDEIKIKVKKKKVDWNLPSGNLKQTLRNIPGNQPIILLAHRSAWAYQAEKAGVDLMLCGHTHGGQLPPLSWLVSILDPFAKGDYRIGTLQLKVSSGAGVWQYLPIRLFSRNMIHEMVISNQ
jgi:predicted MPP superfamily phosphohydrolase